MKASERLIYTNDNGESIEFSFFSVYCATDFKDDDLSNDISTTRANMQDGETMVGHALNTRGISIDGHFRLESTSNILERKLKHICNPKLSGTLVYRDTEIERHIRVIPEAVPEIGRAIGYAKFSLDFIAHDPFWRETEKTEEISLLEPMLKFPLIIPTKGIIFGRKRAALETVIYNIGDVASGFRVVFAARGTVENPIIQNIYTGAQIKILYTMTHGDIIEVINEPSVKQVLINGQKAFRYLDRRNSTFFKLEVGKNTIGYQADTNTVNLDVAVFYSPLYL